MIDNKTIRKVIMLNKMLPSGSPTYENREASGAVANFTTNVVKPFVKCECTIDATESGTSVLTLNHKGKNLFDTNTEFSTLYVYAVAKNVLPSAICTMSFTDNDTTQDISGVYFGFISSNYTGGAPIVCRWGIQNGAVVGNVTNIFSNENMTGLFYYPNNPATLEKILNRFNVQIEIGSTATTYAPYSGNTTPVSLAETAYGGSVDVISGSGRIIDEYGNLVYTLFEPVSISSLEGVNNVWTDVGNTKVTYKYKTGEGGSSTKKYLPIFYDFYRKEKQS